MLLIIVHNVGESFHEFETVYEALWDFEKFRYFSKAAARTNRKLWILHIFGTLLDDL